MIIRRLEVMLSDLYFQFWGERSDLILMHTQFDMMQKEGKYIILVCENEEKIIGSVMGIICRDLYATCLPYYGGGKYDSR